MSGRLALGNLGNVINTNEICDKTIEKKIHQYSKWKAILWKI